MPAGLNPFLAGARLSASRLSTLVGLTRRTATWIPGVAVYGAILVLTRLPFMFGNLLFLDDYGLLVDPFHDLTTGRFPLVLEMAVVEGLAPGFSLSGRSSWLAVLYLAFAAEAVRRLCGDIDLPGPIAILVPVPFLVHPCTNELATWAVTRASGLCLLLSVQGYRVVRRARRTADLLGGGAMILAGVLGYEVSALVPAGFVAAEGGLAFCRGQRQGWKAWRRSLAILVLAVGAVVLVKTAWRRVYPDADPRGTVFENLTPSAAGKRLKVASNVMSNVYLSPLSYYVGFERGGRGWKWIPVAIPVMAMLAWAATTRRLGPALAAGASSSAVLGASVLPALLLPGMNESWRISLPGTIAFAVAMAVTGEAVRGWNRGRWLVPAALLVVSIALVAPSRYHLGRRVRCSEIETAAVASIREFWGARDLASQRFAVAVVYLPDVLPWDPEEDSRVLTEGFVPVTTSSLSSFEAASPAEPGWFVEQFLVHFHRLGILDGDRYRSFEIPASGPGIHRSRIGFLAVDHDVTRRLSVIQFAEPGQMVR